MNDPEHQLRLQAEPVVITLAYHQAAAIGAELRLAVQASSVRRVMELTGLFRLMDVYPSVAAALQTEPGTSQA